MMRYHVNSYHRNQWSSATAHPSAELAEADYGRQVADYQAWIRDLEARLQPNWRGLITDDLNDPDYTEYIRPPIMQLPRYEYRVEPCEDSECIACIEAGLLPTPANLRW